jgi:hypothetical protein
MLLSEYDQEHILLCILSLLSYLAVIIVFDHFLVLPVVAICIALVANTVRCRRTQLEDLAKLPTIFQDPPPKSGWVLVLHRKRHDEWIKEIGGFFQVACGICMEEMMEGDTIVRAPNTECIHMFHEDCVARAFQGANTCHCRVDSSLPVVLNE